MLSFIGIGVSIIGLGIATGIMFSVALECPEEMPLWLATPIAVALVSCGAILSIVLGGLL